MELIKINENGLVNARELHEFLENKRQFSDWIKQRISQYGFIEDEDFTVHKFVNGKATQIDYAITIDMAKELSMVENNEKGKQARKYFIQCEKKIKEIMQPKKLSAMDQLTLHYQVLGEHEERFTKIEGQLERLEVNPSQRKAIQSARHKRVSELLGGKKTLAYKDTSFRSKVYSDMGRAFNNYFDVPSYDCTPKNKFLEALEVIESYNLSTELAMELKRINNQLNLA